MDNLKPHEWQILADILDMAADEFGTHGCNDYDLPHTLENEEFVTKIEYDEWRDNDNDGFYEPFIRDGAITTGDITVMRWFSEFARKMAKDM